MGRPTKLTPELQESLLNALRLGLFIEVACEHVGIHPSTYYGWMERGRGGESPYSEFSEAVMSARAAGTVRAMNAVQKAIQDGDWKAGAWYLERSHPDQYGRRTNLAGANGGPVKVEQTDDEQREARLRDLVNRALEDARGDA